MCSHRPLRLDTCTRLMKPHWTSYKLGAQVSLSAGKDFFGEIVPHSRAKVAERGQLIACAKCRTLVYTYRRRFYTGSVADVTITSATVVFLCIGES